MKKKTAPRTTRARTKPTEVLSDVKKAEYRVDKALGDRIREAREAKKMTQTDLAKNIKSILEHDGQVDKKMGRSNVAQWETARAYPAFGVIYAIAKAVGERPEFIAYGVTDKPVEVIPRPDKLGYVLAPEITIDGANSFTEVQRWGLPISWLKSEMGVTSPEDIIIFKVEMHGTDFEYGDRILVDRSNTRPSPPGDFLYWDGIGPDIVKMHALPGGKKPMVRVTAANNAYEAEIDKLTIIGRVKGLWKKA